MLLPLGVVVAFFMPETGGVFKPAAPFLLALLVSAAMLRLDIAAVLKDAIKPRRLFRNGFLALLLLLATPYCLYHLSLIHISEPTRPLYISYAVFCLKK